MPGVKPGNVVIIGGGTVGLNAAKIALGMGANVTILDVSLERLRYLSDVLDGRLMLLVSNTENIENSVIDADIVIGGLLIPGARASKLLTRSMISKMRKGSVIVDVAIDQGGCVETSLPTTFASPTFVVDGIIHYCVTNIPSCVARTSSFALTNATFPYVLKLASLGLQEALRQDPALRKGLNVFRGKLTNKAIADSLGFEYTSYDLLIAA